MKILPVSKTYDGVKVLDFPGLDLEPGTVTAVIGANGSGKSTFAKILAGVLLADRKGKCLERGTIGYMPQKNYAFRMSTRANILLGGKDPARAEMLMDRLQLRHLERKRADRLSGGETARMAMARLMMGRFDVVLMDEPTAAMDMETTALAETLMLQYVRETGCALILVTHSLQQARRVADRVLYFHKGCLLESGSKSEVLDHPQRPETKRFLEFYKIR